MGLGAFSCRRTSAAVRVSPLVIIRRKPVRSRRAVPRVVVDGMTTVNSVEPIDSTSVRVSCEHLYQREITKELIVKVFLHNGWA